MEKQQIYFAPPEELNDPMEGFRDVYWHGDEIVWRNLLKNYIFCLEHIYTLTLIIGDKFALTSNDVPLYNYPVTNTSSHKLLMLDKIRKRFFARPVMNDLPVQLSQRTKPVRRNELLSHLMFVHQFALNAIEEVYKEEGLITNRLFGFDDNKMEEMILNAGNLVDLYNKVDAENDDNVDKLEMFLQITNAYRKGIPLSNFPIAGLEKMFSNRMFLLSDFDEAFIDRLEALMYPDWYSASFLTNCKNSAIWGHYGDNHKGVCLIYQPKENDDVISMEIKMVTGANSAGPTIGWRAQTFRKVHYDRQHIEIDFFKSLGRSNIALLESTWYRGENGELSECGAHLHNNTDEWRKNYWENFMNSLFIKIKEWEYEQEYRLTIDGNFHDYTDKNGRKLEYKFEDLKGLIFGIKITTADKKKIVSIIKAKCIQTKRTDFEIYQAYYSRATKQIERQKLSLLNLN
ncbi:MAG TPA: DUF2971 domain-containing protein [Mucilaginibacter sp.]|nr:DUF2971 domain-containing protein [Mucilaginibacter sp.]